MDRDRQPTLLDPIRRLIGDGASALTDAELLERYTAASDAAAFEVLIWRHGPMILGLCRRLLRDRHEAEDAFQATFLVFARKARSIGRRDALGSWLYKVAYRIALRARRSAGIRPTSRYHWTAVIYDNVGAGGAKLTKGFMAQVWLADGSEETAAKVLLTGSEPEPWTFVIGKVLEITSNDKDGFTLSVSRPPAVYGDPPMPVMIKVPAGAKVAYFGVGPDEAKPTVGYEVQIQLREGSTDTASQVRFFKQGAQAERGRR